MSWDRLIGVSDARVSVAEAAKIVGKSPETVRRAIRAGALEAERVGARGWWLVDPADVAALIVSSPKAADVPGDAPDAPDAELARDYRTIAELAREFRVSEQHIWRMCVDGRLPAVRVGAVWRIPRQEAQAVITNFRVRAGDGAGAGQAEAGQAEAGQAVCG